jgi:hypothetical protein
MRKIGKNAFISYFLSSFRPGGKPVDLLVSLMIRAPV